jgi:Protein of unknown function (DUF2878)
MTAAVRTPAAPSLPLLIANFVAFQLAWFACVVAAARGQQWLGVAAVLVVAAVFAWLAPRPARALQLFALVTLIGAVWDSAVSATGWMTYAGASAAGWLAPAWIVAMWTLFATLLNVCLRWLRARPALSALFGLVGGPLAYYGGARLGAVSFANLPAALALQGIGWAAMTPLLIRLGVRLEH